MEYKVEEHKKKLKPIASETCRNKMNLREKLVSDKIPWLGGFHRKITFYIGISHCGQYRQKNIIIFILDCISKYINTHLRCGEKMAVKSFLMTYD